MTTLPLTLAMIALSSVQNNTSTTSADLNNDGVVDTGDLILITSNIGTACEGDCQTDLNNDGVTDQNDILVLMQSWGEVAGWVDPNAQVTQSDSNDASDTSSEPTDMSWQGKGPILFEAVYFDQYTRLFSHGGYARWHNAEEYNQGEYTKAWATANNIATQPMVYGSVDWDHDNELTEEDKANFVIWLDETVPTDYNGPICLDLEGQWWSMIDTTNQVVMDIVIDHYLEQLEYAKSLRPDAKIGFWGFPKKSHTNPAINTASVQRLADACTAIFPDVYEHNPGGNDSARLQLHVERAIEMVNGSVPVYAQTFPRYKDSNSSSRDFFHTQEEFMRDQVQSSLAAVWTDAEGVEHRVTGVSFWDAYIYIAMYTEGWSEMSMDERKSIWDDMDHLHIQYLSNMKVAVDAAFAAAQERLAQTTSQEEAENQAAVKAAAVQAAAELRAERKRQRSRLVRRLSSERTKIRRAASSWRKNSKEYRNARSSFKSNRTAFTSSRNAYRSALKEWRTSGSKQRSTARAAAWSKFTTARNTFKASQQTWRSEVQSWRASSRTFRSQRNSYRASRNAWRSTVKQWRTANASWRQMARAATSLASAR